MSQRDTSCGLRDELSSGMPQSLSRILIHVVFSTKNREPSLSSAVRPALFGYLASVGRDIGCEVFRVGGVADHVHLLCRLGRSISLSDLVKELKRTSSLWIKTKSADLEDFHWQTGYGAFSISPGHVDDLIRYIENQESHHHTESFQDEFRRLLTKYGVEWDERYVWD